MTARALGTSGLVSAWLILLFTGFVLGGATHLLLIAALVVFPWRQLPAAAEFEAARSSTQTSSRPNDGR